MSRRNYPCVGGSGPVPQKKTGPGRKKPLTGRVGLVGTFCCIKGCGKPAVRYTDIEFTYMRGDDGVYTLCSEHANWPHMMNIKGFLSWVKEDYNA